MTYGVAGQVIPFQFTGLAAAGLIAITGLLTTDIILQITPIPQVSGKVCAPGAHFDTVISATGQVKQVSNVDLSATVFAVLVFRSV